MQSGAVIARQQMIWRDPPAWPFLWRGGLPVLLLLAVLLYALGPFAQMSIQHSVQQAIRERLDGSGFGWVGLSVSGQNAKLSGAEPAAGAGAQALQLAQVSACPTWLGERRCVGTVSGEFTSPPPAPAAPPPVQTGSAASAAPLSASQRCEQSLAAILGGAQIEFAPGRAAIAPGSAAVLDQLAHQARACPGRLRIEGHTDTIGRGRLNQRLSEARAESVRKALVQRGIPAQRLFAQGYGARRPVADNTSESGRARNRRIEFHLMAGK